MSNLEHLIDCAVYYKEEHYSFEEFKETWTTNVNKETIAAPLEEIWEIANYVYYVYRPYIEGKKEEELVERYGYKVE